MSTQSHNKTRIVSNSKLLNVNSFFFNCFQDIEHRRPSRIHELLHAFLRPVSLGLPRVSLIIELLLKSFYFYSTWNSTYITISILKIYQFRPKRSNCFNHLLYFFCLSTEGAKPSNVRICVKFESENPKCFFIFAFDSKFQMKLIFLKQIDFQKQICLIVKFFVSL